VRLSGVEWVALYEAAPDLKELPLWVDDSPALSVMESLSTVVSSSARGWRPSSGTGARKAGLRITCYQGTRHSLATQPVNKGVGERIIGAMLGHKNVASPRRYAKLSRETLRAVWIEDKSPVRPHKEVDK
jgi:hypothetical protein